MSDTSKKILEEIHERNLKPHSKRYFVVRNVAVWSALLASVVLCALSISLEELVFENAGPYGSVGAGLTHLLFNGVSFLWIFSTIMFMVLAYLNIRSTDEGYRYRTAWIVIAILLVSLTLGVWFHSEGIDRHFESIFEPQPCPAQSCPVPKSGDVQFE